MTSDSERLGVLEAELRGHMKADELGFARINTDTAEIKTAVVNLTSKVESSFERIHSRIDDEASKARHALNNAQMIARGETKVAMDFAQDAHDKINEVNQATTSTGDRLKIWVLTNALTGGLALVALAGWLIEHLEHAK